MNYISDKSKMPQHAHWAVLVFSTIHIPGDERSRTHPGHGYGESTESVVNYIAFAGADELKTWLDRNHTNNNFQVIECKPKKHRINVSVSVE